MDEILSTFKSSASALSTNLTIMDIALSLTITVIISLFIYAIYRQTYQGVLYTKSFNLSLIMVAVITSLIIMAISTNFLLSLGMVGALSIVRFRTAIKDSLDTVFMFWAISIGMANGVGLYKVSIIGSLVIGGLLFAITKIKILRRLPYLLVINYPNKNNAEIDEALASLKKLNIKSKIRTNDEIELILEMRQKRNDTSIIDRLAKVKSIRSVAMINYNGDYVS
ncbi:MAG: DUF4956 domain-containing protein [bacterium]